MADRRILFLSNVFPLPTDDGTKMRVLNLLDAVSELGEVDFFTLGDPEGDLSRLPARRVEGIDRRSAWGTTSNLRWLTSSLPYPWPGRDMTEAQRKLADWMALGYDLIFYNRVETWLTFGRIDAPVVVLDFDVLEPERVRTRISAPSGPTGLRRLRSLVDISRWERLERRVAETVDLGMVCNHADAAILGDDRALVVPNGYEDAPPAGFPEHVSDQPLIGMVAAYGYGPNRDAAEVLVTEVMPEILARAPGARLVLVGKDGETLLHLAEGRPWLEITGWVDRVTDWLAKIDVMVMPVAHGGGTRVKVLEALCHRVPVVAHPYTVAGLEVSDGVHALLAETPTEMAEHTALLLRDAATRLALADAGRALFETSYTWEASRRIVVEAVGALLK